ncbi:SLATT domain-containing protein [Psychromonas hadalis]|uniref:SLATT domain-containing protein n=1 Tax=Psychromonas hadalis TaxID=211669 RepID=UPI0003B51C2A|nr:SLATT domain-containing protein [Psychromonas hadalis]
MREQQDHVDLDALSTITETVLTNSKVKAQWYQDKKGLRSFMARAIRLLMIFGTLTAALIPLLATIFVENDIALVSPAWSAVATAVVASLFAFEKYYGHGNAWMRFNDAEMKINQKVELLEFDWQDYKYREQVKKTQAFPEWTKRLKEHNNEVFEIETSETNAWTKEFQQVMTDTYKQKKKTLV